MRSCFHDLLATWKMDGASAINCINCILKENGSSDSIGTHYAVQHF